MGGLHQIHVITKSKKDKALTFEGQAQSIVKVSPLKGLGFRV
jgi:hypothetical protein